jgi:hypothetical protein
MLVPKRYITFYWSKTEATILNVENFEFKRTCNPHPMPELCSVAPLHEGVGCQSADSVRQCRVGDGSKNLIPWVTHWWLLWKIHERSKEPEIIVHRQESVSTVIRNGWILYCRGFHGLSTCSHRFVQRVNRATALLIEIIIIKYKEEIISLPGDS